MQQEHNNKVRLAKAQALVAALKAGHENDADRLISDLSKQKESDLFLEVGRLTRELHEAINSFLLDARLAEMTTTEIPNAKERLNYVITMTQQAADRSLTAVEKSVPLVRDLEKNSGIMLVEWEKHRARILKKNDFKELSDCLLGFLNQTKLDSNILQQNLSEVLMAQAFQDLTGQIISKVISLVQDVEEKLIMLVRITGGKQEGKDKDHQDPNLLEGPGVPGIDQGEQMTSQDDVDDLLSSLGF